ncbi:MAG TPA: hypothetical protein VFX65_01710 [Candidatus Limnocylindrales bacterium]|nr:hypothetical protein [Candidatus Limnocylindrales bacterium]
MADPSGAPPPAAPPPTDWGTEPAEAYVEENLDRFTAEALVDALVTAGHDADAATDAARRAVARRGAAPVRAQARQVFLVAYGLTYATLMIVLLASPSRGGYGQLAAVILTVTLGLAAAISAGWLRRGRGPTSLLGLLSLPLVLLAAVGGICAMSLPGIVGTT